MSGFKSQKKVRTIYIIVLIFVFLITIYFIFIRSVNKNIFFKKTHSISDLTTEDQIAVSQMQQFLFNEFSPGSCFGEPPEHVIATASKKISFDEKKPNGDFIFSFTDGDCCEITHYEIKIRQETDQFQYEILDQDSSNVPC